MGAGHSFYRYSPDRKGERPAKHLRSFRGILHADGYVGYDRLYGERTGIAEMACMAHVRRKLFDSGVGKEEGVRAAQILSRLGERSIHCRHAAFGMPRVLHPVGEAGAVRQLAPGDHARLRCGRWFGERADRAESADEGALDPTKHPHTAPRRHRSIKE